MITYPERGDYNMRTWNDYKEHVKAVDPVAANDIDDVESIAAIVGALIEKRNSLGISNVSLLRSAECHSPQLQELSHTRLLQILIHFLS